MNCLQKSSNAALSSKTVKVCKRQGQCNGLKNIVNSYVMPAVLAASLFSSPALAEVTDVPDSQLFPSGQTTTVSIEGKMSIDELLDMVDDKKSAKKIEEIAFNRKCSQALVSYKEGGKNVLVSGFEGYDSDEVQYIMQAYKVKTKSLTLVPDWTGQIPVECFPDMSKLELVEAN